LEELNVPKKQVLRQNMENAMKRTIQLAVSAMTFGFLLNTAAFAAGIELQVLQGDVLLDQGEGLVAVHGTTTLAPGSKLVMRENGAALLNYIDEQCFIRLAPASVTRIAKVAPCASGSFAAVSKTTIIEPANGVYEVLPPPPPGYESAGIAPLIAGGGFAAAAALSFIYVQVNAEKDKTISHY
jgi:hypothetical protein